MELPPAVGRGGEPPARHARLDLQRLGQVRHGGVRESEETENTTKDRKQARGVVTHTKATAMVGPACPLDSVGSTGGGPLQ